MEKWWERWNTVREGCLWSYLLTSNKSVSEFSEISINARLYTLSISFMWYALFLQPPSATEVLKYSECEVSVTICRAPQSNQRKKKKNVKVMFSWRATLLSHATMKTIMILAAAFEKYHGGRGAFVYTDEERQQELYWTSGRTRLRLIFVFCLCRILERI